MNEMKIKLEHGVLGPETQVMFCGARMARLEFGHWLVMP